MRIITDESELDAIYGTPSSGATAKVVDRLIPLYRDWIGAARFCVLTTVGPEGTDGSPRGEDGPVVRIIDDKTLQMPDWRGNNRLDSLRNIVRDGRVSLMLMVPGSSTVVRVNGTARLSADPDVTESFEQNGKHPKTVIVITIGELYFQCAKAIMRAGLWSRDDSAGLPTAGQFLKERDPGFDAETYDVTYPEQARERMW